MNNRKGTRGKTFWERLLWLPEASERAHALISFILLMIMAVQPLQGIFSDAITENDMITLFLGRAGLIRGLGYALLLNALIYYIRRLVTYKNVGATLRGTFLKQPWNAFFLLLLIWSIICVRFADNRTVAVYGDPARYEGVLSYIAYAGFFAGASLLRDDARKRVLFYTMGGVAVLLGLLTVLRYYTRTTLFLSYMDEFVVGGLSGTFVNTNHFGYYLCTMACVLFGSAFFAEELWKKLLCVVGGLVLCTVLFLNNTMGSILAIVFGAAVLFLLCALRKGGKTKLIALCGVCAVIVLAASLTVFSVKRPETNQLTHDIANMVQDVDNILAGNITGKEGTERLGIWMADFALLKDHPITGCGTDNAYYAVAPYYGIMKMPHNEYLAMFVNLGIPGGILYLLALFSLFFGRIFKIRKLSDSAIIAGGAAFTYAVSAFFGVALCTMLPFFYTFLRFFADGTQHAGQEA